ncbi:zf-HC2 domain-containing protein [Actinoplanes sp. NPDC023936]|uniref:zf-HC2 domain-containing protein n=1 Tax=Actinoplanes sp. NPDC023936 TaxID=3154910 RepID=UPI0033C45464
MNAAHPTGAESARWHASPALLTAYAEGRAPEADAWSVEAHLVACAACRAELAAVMAPPDLRLLHDVRDAVLSRPPQPLPAPARQRVRWLRWATQPGALLTVVLAVAATTLLDLLAGNTGESAGSLLWLLAPAIPVAGVALAAVGEDDPCWEAVLAAPSAMLRLTLWRTLVVLAVAIPLTVVAGLVRGAAGGDAGWTVAWLLPCAALTTATLAVGSVLGVERAARAAVVLWCAGTLGLPLLRSGGDLLAAARLTAQPLAESIAFNTTAQPLWAAATGLAALALYLNRERFQLVTANNWSNR